MLSALTVRDIVLIESATLEFAPGLNVLTGETGAGKSILLDALGLAAGGRVGARAAARPGAAQGSAIAVFSPVNGHPARRLLTESAIDDAGDIILRRVISADGRTRALVNDMPVGVALLRDLGSMLVEVHGQADDRGLFDTATHRKLLDDFGRHENLSADVAVRFVELEKARQAVDALRRDAAAVKAEADFIHHAVEELAALAPAVGEEEALASSRALLMNANRIGEDISAIIDALSGEQGAESTIAAALKRLGRMGDEARQAASTAEAALEQAFALTEEARRELGSLLSRLELDPQELEKREDRLYALRDAARKYGVTPDRLPALLAEFESKRDAIETGDARIAEADKAVVDMLSAWQTAAEKLSEARRKAASALETAVAGELKPLKLGHARFRVALVPLESESGNGAERVAFELATVEGASFGPLAKIASGGELARFSLALKVALAEASPPAALVFDEVDRGVGGAVADAVGERLQKLARSTQVLLVTHSPQVAARANRHFRISRTSNKTQVHLLSDEERLEELARMLSGAAITEEARAAARRLLTEAHAPKKAKRNRV
ncbi:MAG: DNA repair protein RecN [Alphaproteobacteria bacterium]|jgi:DNA repair protein RecN (Recombination protein N)|nr:DNA repair protein RecN [Alphaproteobacteria bacterium]MBN9567537.1 DNA repair protein RecN [Alphaproteobacteria bacterium]MBN9571196.1 DNA repair protein RecN [Alphaproteobacteria bacterium]OJU57410.1 MAG: DNA repair protein RecN [Alphaproteobacteria bacterium 62-8]